MSGDQVTEWVLDSLIGFLKGPFWNDPLFAFMDEKSVIFGPEDEYKEQDIDSEHEKVFKEYRQLVSQLLNSHMNELGISASQFEKAMEQAEGVLSCRFHHTLFDQIWAANDLVSFKRMMTQINIDLQLWALERLAARIGRVPDAFLPLDSEGSNNEYITSEDYFMREAVRRSIADNDDHSLPQRFTRTVKVSIERPPSAVALLSDDGVESIEISKPSREKTSPVAPEDPFKSSENATGVKMTEVDVNAVRLSNPKKGAAQTAHKVLSHTPSEIVGEKLDAEEIKQRQEYLRRQRDKLLGLKQEEREKQAARLQRLEKSGRRPSTAKFIALEESSVTEDEKKDKTRAYMRSLAARIKAEVLGESNNSSDV